MDEAPRGAARHEFRRARRTSRSCGTPRVTTARSRSGPKSSRPHAAHRRARCTMVERCTAIDGTWGLRAENVELAQRVARPLMERGARVDAELVAGDCQLANVAIDEDTGQAAGPPAAGLARAYGIEEDVTMRKLTVDDIIDHARLRARTCDEFRRHIIELKKRRRIPLGTIMTIVFENTRHDALPGAGDGARRTHAERRADRARDRDVQRADPRTGRALGDALHRAQSEEQLREWLPEARRHPASTSRSCFPTAARCAASPRTRSA